MNNKNNTEKSLKKRPLDQLVRDLDDEETNEPTLKRINDIIFTDSEEEDPKDEKEEEAVDDQTIRVETDVSPSIEIDMLHPTQYMAMHSVERVKIFPHFIGFFYKTGLAELGASVVYFPQDDLFANRDAIFKKLEKMVVHRTKKQTVCETLMDNKLIKIRQKTKGPTTVQKLITDNPSNVIIDVGKGMTQFDAYFNDVLAYMLETSVVFAKDVDESIFAVTHKGWNFMDLDNDLTGIRSVNYRDKADLVDTRIEGKGLTHPSLFVGTYGAVFGLGRQEDSLGTIYYLHEGIAVMWFIIPPKFAEKLEEMMAKHCPKDHEACEGFILHKKWFVHPDLLNEWEIPFSVLNIVPGSYLVIAAGTYYQGLSLGYTIGESINFLTKDILPAYKMASSTCYCDYKIVQLPRNIFVGKYQPERYQLFIEGKDVDKSPCSDQRVIAMNDNVRAFNYLKNHAFTRKRNMGINAKTGKPYKPKEDKFDDTLFENLKKTIGRLSSTSSDESS